MEISIGTSLFAFYFEILETYTICVEKQSLCVELCTKRAECVRLMPTSIEVCEKQGGGL